MQLGSGESSPYAGLPRLPARRLLFQNTGCAKCNFNRLDPGDYLVHGPGPDCRTPADRAKSSPLCPASKSSLVRCPPADPDLGIHPCDPSITTTVQARRVLVEGRPVPPLALELIARSLPLSASSSLGDSTNGRAAPSRCVALGAVSSGREHIEPVVEALAAGVAVVSHAYAASLSGAG